MNCELRNRNYRKLAAGSLKPLLGFLALVPLAAAQSGTFAILMNGERVGNATCNFTSAAQGYNATSIVQVSMPGLDYSLSKTEKLSASDELEHVLLSGVVNREAVSIVAAPNSNQIVLEISANGRKTVSSLAGHTGAFIMPDLDPGAFNILLALAARHENRGLWAVIPRKQGSIQPVQLATYADGQGTLDGKLVVVHHLVATIGGAKTDLFSGPDNRLLQAELPQDGFALVRKGFVLKPSAHAAAPPSR